MENSYTFLDQDTVFDGDVRTDHLVLEGKITGDIRASEEVVLKRGAVVQGEIATRKFMVEEGAVHVGNLQMDVCKQEDTDELDSMASCSHKEAKNENEKITSFQPIHQIKNPLETSDNDSESRKKVVGGEPMEERLW